MSIQNLAKWKDIVGLGNKLGLEIRSLQEGRIRVEGAKGAVEMLQSIVTSASYEDCPRDEECVDDKLNYDSTASYIASICNIPKQ